MAESSLLEIEVYIALHWCEIVLRIFVLFPFTKIKTAFRNRTLRFEERGKDLKNRDNLNDTRRLVSLSLSWFLVFLHGAFQKGMKNYEPTDPTYHVRAVHFHYERLSSSVLHS